MPEGTLEDLKQMEAEFAEEFGELGFHYTVDKKPFGMSVDLDDPKKNHPLVYMIYLRGTLTLPNGNTATGVAMLQEGHSPQQYLEALALVSLSCLRRLARFYRNANALPFQAIRMEEGSEIEVEQEVTQC